MWVVIFGWNLPKVLILGIVWSLTLFFPNMLPAGDAASRPNIIFIYADDWGWGDLSSRGDTFVKTPNLDRLRAEGTDFTQFNVLSPVCSASRAAVMTGHYPARLSIHQHFSTPENNRERGMPDWLDAEAVMLPRLLREAGYATAHFGKWHLNTVSNMDEAPTPQAYGYDRWGGWTGIEPALSHRNIYQAAIDFLRDHPNQPVFINLWMHESHTPHKPSGKNMARFKDLGLPEQVYAAVIADGDDGIGQIMAGLQELGFAEKTLLVFSSDNGPESKSNRDAYAQRTDLPSDYYSTFYSVGKTGGLRGRKRSLFEGGIRTPFLVRWPGKVPAGKVNNTTVIAAVDLLPTFCAAAGVRLPKGYDPDGENLLPALLGEDQVRAKPLFWEWRGHDADPDWWPRLAVREGDWKLVTKFDRDRVELYNLSADSAESVNMAGQHPELVERMMDMVMAWKKTLPTEADSRCQGQTDQSKP
jgi:N-acetylgalactosamine-6-sulfatase